MRSAGGRIADACRRAPACHPPRTCTPLANGAGPAASAPPSPNEPRSCCWPPRAHRHRDRPPGRLLAPDRHLVAAPLPKVAWTGCWIGPARADPRPSDAAAEPRSWPLRCRRHRALGVTPGRRGCSPTSSGSATHVARVWASRPQAWRTRPSSSPRPQLEAKVRDVVGLYLDRRAGHRCLRGREEPDPGDGPHAQPAATPGSLSGAPTTTPARDDTTRGDAQAGRAPPLCVSPRCGSDSRAWSGHCGRACRWCVG